VITNLRYADDIILLATSEAELQELVDCLDRVSRKYSLLINVDKTKVMVSDGIVCRILIQNEQLEQVDTFLYLGSLITEDGECTTEFRTRLCFISDILLIYSAVVASLFNKLTYLLRLNRGQAIGASLQKIWKSHSTPISTKIRLMNALVWPVATYGRESWTLRKNEETRFDAFEMKGLGKILRISWTAKKANEWVLNKARVKRKLLDIVNARKLAYYGHTMRKQGSCLEKEIMQGTMPGARKRGRPRTAWMDNIKTRTGLSVEESINQSDRGQI